MHVMVGETRGKWNMAILKREDMGRMWQKNTPTPRDGERWGFDCDAYSPWSQAGFPQGLDIDSWLILWDSNRFERRLAKAYCLPPPYIAVTPDIPAGGLASLEFSWEWRKDLPHSWPWYLSVQDGMTGLDLAWVDLTKYTGIFLGGSDRFKGEALKWCQFAHKHGLKFHYGRAGTLDKVRHAYMVGADSCDSSFPLWTKDRFRKFIAHCCGLPKQGCLEVSNVY